MFEASTPTNQDTRHPKTPRTLAATRSTSLHKMIQDAWHKGSVASVTRNGRPRASSNHRQSLFNRSFLIPLVRTFIEGTSHTPYTTLARAKRQSGRGESAKQGMMGVQEVCGNHEASNVSSSCGKACANKILPSSTYAWQQQCGMH